MQDLERPGGKWKDDDLSGGWITIDLGGMYDVQRVSVRHATGDDGEGDLVPADFNVCDGPADGGSSGGGRGRYVRINITREGDGLPRIYTVDVFGSPTDD